MPGKKKGKGKKRKNKNKGKGIGKKARVAQEARREIDLAKEWLSEQKVTDILNPQLFDPEYIAASKARYAAAQPFPNLTLEDFLNPDYAARMEEEFKGLEYFMKSNDLYEFVQSADLNKVELPPLLAKFRELLYSAEFRAVIEEVTGLKTVDVSTDMFAAVYQNGHHLLPHDDELHDRVIAYIYYMVPGGKQLAPAVGDFVATDTAQDAEDTLGEEATVEEDAETRAWSLEDGGSLDLYNVDANNEPTTIAARKVPKWNSLAFFTVSEKSFHKVDEVVTPVKGRSRSSLGGWFHGTPTKRPERKQSVLPPFHAPSAAEYKLEDWLTRDYRRPNTMKQLLAHFLEESSIEIDNFMRADKYAELTAALEAAEEAKWSAVGPVNKQKFSEYTTGEETKTDVLADFQGFMLSKVFTDYLSKITGLDSSICWSQLRRFQVGDYTLGHDTDPELQECGLEGSFSCLPKSYGKKWRDNCGGTLHYSLMGEEEELIRVYPKVNSLMLVYRAEPGIYGFTKYVNNRAPGAKYDYKLLYRIVDSDDEDSDASM